MQPDRLQAPGVPHASAHPDATLAVRLSNGPMPLPAALEVAADVAGALRAMHYEGHAHGWVHPAAITLSSGKAVLQNSTTTRQATARGDIQAFGALLHEMLQGRKPANEVPIPVVPRGVPRSGYEGLKAAAGKLAARCLSDDSVAMQYVVTEVRLLKVLSRYNPPPGRAEDPPQVSSDCEPVESERLALKRCPNCGSSFVYESKARTAIERLLDSTGVPLRRCRRCYHRYVTVLGVHFTKAGPSE